MLSEHLKWAGVPSVVHPPFSLRSQNSPGGGAVISPDLQTRKLGLEERVTHLLRGKASPGAQASSPDDRIRGTVPGVSYRTFSTQDSRINKTHLKCLRTHASRSSQSRAETGPKADSTDPGRASKWASSPAITHAHHPLVGPYGESLLSGLSVVLEESSGTGLRSWF